jgi:hypothetical protein
MIVGAAVVGTVAGRHAAAQQPQTYETAPAPAPAPTPAPAPAGADINTQIQQLAQMHNAGVLTDEEFAQAKAKLLA